MAFSSKQEVGLSSLGGLQGCFALPGRVSSGRFEGSAGEGETDVVAPVAEAAEGVQVASVEALHWAQGSATLASRSAAAVAR